MTVLYPNLCYNEMCYKETLLYKFSKLKLVSAPMLILQAPTLLNTLHSEWPKLGHSECNRIKILSH